MWKCKTCEFSASSRSNLLKHYKLKHKHCGRSHSFPCMHSSCPCSFFFFFFFFFFKLGWALFVTYTIIQSIMRSEMCSLHLTHPSVHTWSSGQPTVQRPGSSRGLPVGAGIWTHNLGLPRVSSPTLYPLGQRLPVILRLGMLYWSILVESMQIIKILHNQNWLPSAVLCVQTVDLVVKRIILLISVHIWRKMKWLLACFQVVIFRQMFTVYL